MKEYTTTKTLLDLFRRSGSTTSTARRAIRLLTEQKEKTTLNFYCLLFGDIDGLQNTMSRLAHSEFGLTTVYNPSSRVVRLKDRSGETMGFIRFCPVSSEVNQEFINGELCVVDPSVYYLPDAFLTWGDSEEYCVYQETIRTAFEIFTKTYMDLLFSKETIDFKTHFALTRESWLEAVKKNKY
jgi:hypothetical protein